MYKKKKAKEVRVIFWIKYNLVNLYTIYKCIGGEITDYCRFNILVLSLISLYSNNKLD